VGMVGDGGHGRLKRLIIVCHWCSSSCRGWGIANRFSRFD
jgi:hypothetical protein